MKFITFDFNIMFVAHNGICLTQDYVISKKGMASLYRSHAVHPPKRPASLRTGNPPLSEYIHMNTYYKLNSLEI